MTRQVLLRCDSTGDLYPVTVPSLIPHAFLVRQHTWHQRLGHLGSEVLHHLVSHNFISCTKEKPPVLCHACQLGKHIVLSLAVSRHWLIHQLDVKNAFLHGDLSETVYMHQPPGFRDSTYPDHVCISVTRDSSGMFLSQRKYATEILEWDGMVSCNSSRTPVNTESKRGDDGDPVSHLTLYRSLTGSLQYLTFTRPDISYAVQQLFSSSTTDLFAYSDADWAGCPTTRRSTSRYCVLLGNNLLSWSSKPQSTLSYPSTEAEYRGVTNVVTETYW
ncbi:ribonuclease H-like domain-containing protein [Tanacetum coccineum]